MEYSEHALRLIKHFEGCSLESYQDSAGVWTIGYGHTQGVKPNQSISQSQAETMLKHDLEHFSFSVFQLLQEQGIQADQNQFDALVSFAFNVGIENLRTSTLLKKFKQQDIKGTAQEFLRWDKATVDGRKVVLKGLTNRRNAELSLFLGEPSVF